jgi:hypothetical protein
MKWEEFDDTKGVIRIRKSKDKQHNNQKSPKHYTDNWWSNNRNPLIIGVESGVWKGEQFLLHKRIHRV